MAALVGPEKLEALPGMPPSRWVTLEGDGGATGRDVDRRTHYVDFGGPETSDDTGAPVIVLVHGLGGSTVDWAALAPRLAPVAHVLAFDFAGHGRTPGAGRPADVESHRAHLAAFLRHFAGGPAILVGNSMGGVISLLQAAKDPTSVRGLVLIDPALPVPRNQVPDPLVAGAFASYLLPLLAGPLLALRRRRVAPAHMVSQALALTTAHPERIPAPIVAAYVAQNIERRGRDDVDGPFLASARSLLALIVARPAPLRRAIAAVTAPTLLLHGERDRLVPVRAARLAQADRPDWSLVIHPDAGHVPQLEDADWVSGEILAWLPADPSGT
ncbi:MAG: alpha/beta fold hydrolase [Frankia sp.]